MRISILGKSNSNIQYYLKFKIKNSRNLINKKSSTAELEIYRRILTIFNFQSSIKNKGFTLLELSLVILVIGMVLALILPNLVIPKAKLDREREIGRISHIVKHLYGLSQAQNTDIALLFNLDTNTFWAVPLISGEKGSEDILPQKKIGSSVKIKDIVDLEGNKITEGLAHLVFYPAGFVDPVTIHFMSKGGEFYTMFINPLTAQSRVETGYLEKE